MASTCRKRARRSSRSFSSARTRSVRCATESDPGAGAFPDACSTSRSRPATRNLRRSFSRSNSSVNARARLNMLRSSSPRAERSSRSPPRGPPSRLRFISANIGPARTRCNPVTASLTVEWRRARTGRGASAPAAAGHLQSDLRAWQDQVRETGPYRLARHAEHGGGLLRLHDGPPAPILDGAQPLDTIPPHSGHEDAQGARAEQLRRRDHQEVRRGGVALRRPPRPDVEDDSGGKAVERGLSSAGGDADRAWQEAVPVLRLGHRQRAEPGETLREQGGEASGHVLRHEDGGGGAARQARQEFEEGRRTAGGAADDDQIRRAGIPRVLRRAHEDDSADGRETAARSRVICSFNASARTAILSGMSGKRRPMRSLAWIISSRKASEKRRSRTARLNSWG